MRLARFRLEWWCLVVVLLCGCRPLVVPNPNFREPSVAGVIAVSDLTRMSVGAQRPEVKFVITSFDQAKWRRVTLLDGHFYRMHDEWYWMRLLNGYEVPGSTARPVANTALASVDEAYAWARQQHRLPLDLAWSEDGRLYSSHFYEQCFGDGRAFGIGSLLRVRTHTSGPVARWAFQLEYLDQPSRTALHVFFNTLRDALPAEIGAQLLWLTRSPEQIELVRELSRVGDSLATRIVHLKDLTTSDRVEVYSEGITAGRIRMFKNRPPTPGMTGPDDIVVLAAAPDELPAAAGLVTATPQTPLAHVTLLAQDRGIPNAFVDQVFTDPLFDTVMEDGSKAILRAEAPNRLTLKPITEEEFALWNRLRKPTPLTPVHVDASKAAYVLDPSQLKYSDLRQLTGIIGGKAAGYLLLSTQGRSLIPAPARVITTRAYDEHLVQFRTMIESLLNLPAFKSDPMVRFILLEGIDRFRTSYPFDTKTVPRFLAQQGKGGPWVRFAQLGGLTAAICRAPIAAPTLRRLREELTRAFDQPNQALRFRSSSTVEDLEGFNAAGLYESATGYLNPIATSGGAGVGAKRSPKSQHGIEEAIKRVWASYWGFVAFEERRRELIDHHYGSMAVLVHPRFDDNAELANGVVTFTKLPSEANAMHVSVQLGASSVTNPRGGALPEVITLTRDANAAAAPNITRLRYSSLSQHALLDQAQLVELYESAKALTETAREAANTGLGPLQRRRTYTLDIEFRLMQSSWLTPGSTSEPPRLVLKQARSLEPELRGLDPRLLAEPIPRDLLMRARRINRHTCQGAAVRVALLSLLTDVKSIPDLGYRDRPFTAWVKLEKQGDVPATWLNQDFARLDRPSKDGEGAWAISGELSTAAAGSERWRSIELTTDRLILTHSNGANESVPVHCTNTTLFNTPDAYLLDLLGEQARR